MNFDGRPGTEPSFANLVSTLPCCNGTDHNNHSGTRADPRNTPPCPTLFVASLGPNCSEHELIQVFSSCRGYLKLKKQSSYGAPVAFVDFQDTVSSSEVLARLQGTILYSSPPGKGMQSEYARSRMGMRSKKSR